MPAIDWGSLAPYLIAFWTPAIALLTAYVAHIWDERSKREEFRREKRFDRKFMAYQQVLNTLARMRDILELRQDINTGEVQKELENLAKQVPTTLPEPDRSALLESLLTAHYEFMIQVRSGALDYPAAHSPPLPRLHPMNPAVLFADRLNTMTYHAMAHSFNDYGKAVNIVKALGYSEQLSDAIEAVWTILGGLGQKLGSGSAVPEEEWNTTIETLDKATDEMVILINEDLNATAAGKDPVEVTFIEESGRPAKLKTDEAA